MKQHERFNVVKEVVTKIRSMRSENKVPHGKKIPCIVTPHDEEHADIILQNYQIIASMAQLSELKIDLERIGENAYLIFPPQND